MKTARAIGAMIRWITSRVRSVYGWLKDGVYSWGERLQPINPIFTFASLCAVIFTILLSFQNIRKSEDFGSTLIAHMDSLSTLFARVNDQISYLPESVSKFDSTLRGLNEDMADQQQEFRRSITALHRNVDAFSKGIQDYGRTLAKIVVASDKQLSLLEKRQELLEKELMKKPKLALRVKQCTKDTLERSRMTVMPEILNTGDATAEYCRILLTVPHQYGFTSPGFRVYDSTAQMQHWSYNLSGFVGYSSDKKDYPLIAHPQMQFSVTVPSGSRPGCEMDYVIYHNKGEDRGKLVLNLHKCR